MKKISWRDLGNYELIFNVSDLYNYTEFAFAIEITDVTPVPLAPPVPELPPGFISPIETIQVLYTLNQTNEPVSYILPETFDYNFDSF